MIRVSHKKGVPEESRINRYNPVADFRAAVGMVTRKTSVRMPPASVQRPGAARAGGGGWGRTGRLQLTSGAKGLWLVRLTD